MTVELRAALWLCATKVFSPGKIVGRFLTFDGPCFVFKIDLGILAEMGTWEVSNTVSSMSSGVSAIILALLKLTVLSGVSSTNLGPIFDVGGDADCNKTDLVAAETNMVDCLRDLEEGLKLKYFSFFELLMLAYLP